MTPLTDRELETLAWRYWSKAPFVPTQEQLAMHYGVSETRVQQYESRALKKIYAAAGQDPLRASGLLRTLLATTGEPDWSSLPKPRSPTPRTQGYVMDRELGRLIKDGSKS